MDFSYILGQSVKSYKDFEKIFDSLLGNPQKLPESQSLKTENSLLDEEYKLLSLDVNDWSFSSRSYFFADMQDITESLYLLSFLHSLEKYDLNPVNKSIRNIKTTFFAKEYIGYFVHNRYYLDPFVKEAEILFGFNSNTFTEETPLPNELEMTPAPKKELAAHWKAFFEEKLIDNFPIKYRSAKNPVTPLVSTYDLPEFLLSFQLYDGTNFPLADLYKSTAMLPWGKKRLPHHTKFTLHSYESVLHQIKNHFIAKQEFDKQVSMYCAIHLAQLDKIFKFARINLIREYYRLYTDQTIIDYLRQVFLLDTATLKSEIDNIFFDDEKMLQLFNDSPYLDFFLPFDIHFRYLVLLYKNDRMLFYQITDKYYYEVETESIRADIFKSIIKQCFSYAIDSLEEASKNRRNLNSLLDKYRKNMVATLKKAQMEKVQIEKAKIDSLIQSLLKRIWPSPKASSWQCSNSFYYKYFGAPNQFIEEMVALQKTNNDKRALGKNSYHEFSISMKEMVTLGLDTQNTESIIRATIPTYPDFSANTNSTSGKDLVVVVTRRPPSNPSPTNDDTTSNQK